LTIQNSPWHAEVCEFSETIAQRLRQRGKINTNYSIATEHEHSCCILLAREDKFKIDGKWHTWIDYPKFNELIAAYYASGGKATFKSSEYMAQTPEWALYQSKSHGFDPAESRWKRNAKGQAIEIEYKSSESGCG
jgi:tRNA wybutosine-synthesizing protein 1